MTICPKCRGRMTAGYLCVPDYGAMVKWTDGEPSFWAALGFGSKATDLTSRRCSQCGFVEFYADTRAMPVKTLSAVDDETERLKSLIAVLQERIAVLERIATDPAERTAREIENLREFPPTRDDCSPS